MCVGAIRIQLNPIGGIRIAPEVRDISRIDVSAPLSNQNDLNTRSEWQRRNNWKKARTNARTPEEPLCPGVRTGTWEYAADEVDATRSQSVVTPIIGRQMSLDECILSTVISTGVEDGQIV